jgi:hypothetical protein
MYKITVSARFFKSLTTVSEECSLDAHCIEFASELQKFWEIGVTGEHRSIFLKYGFSPSINIVFVVIS